MNFKSEQGSISILVIAFSIAGLVLISLIGTAISLLIKVNQLNNAADRVALGAATFLVGNPDLVCETAANLAISNSVEIKKCEVQDDEVLIEVDSTEFSKVWLGQWPKVGVARAGIDYLFD